MKTSTLNRFTVHTSCKQIVMIGGAFLIMSLASTAHAQSTTNPKVQVSPFGQATAQQQQAAIQAEKDEQKALKAWNNLPDAKKTSLMAQMAPMSETERLALLETVPQFKNNSPEQFQAVLTQIAVVAPYPVLLTIRPVSLPSSHFLNGRRVQLGAYVGDTLQISGITWSASSGFDIFPDALDGYGSFSTHYAVVKGPGTATATQSATGGKASTTLTAHVVSTALSANPLSLSRSGTPTTLSGTASVDARIPEGTPEGYLLFRAKVVGAEPGTPPVDLCNASLQGLPDDGSGLKKSSASCTVSGAGLPTGTLPESVDIEAQFVGQGTYRGAGTAMPATVTVPLAP